MDKSEISQEAKETWAVRAAYEKAGWDFERVCAEIDALPEYGPRQIELSDSSDVADHATTEPVSNPYKFEWREDGESHVLYLDGKRVGEIAPPDEYFRYYWRGGLTWGFRNSLADAMWEVKQAVEADAKAAAENVAQR